MVRKISVDMKKSKVGGDLGKGFGLQAGGGPSSNQIEGCGAYDYLSIRGEHKRKRSGSKDVMHARGD